MAFIDDVMSSLPPPQNSAPKTEAQPSSSVDVSSILSSLPPKQDSSVGQKIIDYATNFNKGAGKYALGALDSINQGLSTDAGNPLFPGIQNKLSEAIKNVAKQRSEDAAQATIRTPSAKYAETAGEVAPALVAGLVPGGLMTGAAAAGGLQGIGYDPEGNYSSNIMKDVGLNMATAGVLKGVGSSIAGAIKGTDATRDAIKAITAKALGGTPEELAATNTANYSAAKAMGEGIQSSQSSAQALLKDLATRRGAGINSAKNFLEQQIGNGSPRPFNELWDGVKESGAALRKADGMTVGLKQEIQSSMKSDLMDAAAQKPGLADAVTNATDFFKNNVVPSTQIEKAALNQTNKPITIANKISEMAKKMPEGSDQQTVMQQVADATKTKAQLDSLNPINQLSSLKGLVGMGEGSVDGVFHPLSTAIGGMIGAVPNAMMGASKYLTNPTTRALLKIPVSSDAQRRAVLSAIAIKSAVIPATTALTSKG